MENKNKLTTVLVSGNFNVLHPGHIRLLRFAKESGDYLIVAVESDRIAGSAAHGKVVGLGMRSQELGAVC